MTTTRLAPPRVPSGKIAVQAPPEIEPSDGGSSLLSSMLPMLGSVGAIVMVSVSNTGITGLLTGGMFLLSSIGFVAVNGWRQRSQRQTSVTASRREYLAYLSQLRQTIRVAAKQQRRAANWLNPAPTALTYIAEERTRVWERSPQDPDFLRMRVGTNDQSLCVTLEAPELPPLAQLDPVAASAAHRFMIAHQTQKDLPLDISALDYSRIQVTGDEAEVRSLVRAMLLQAATMHGPDSLHIAIAAEDGALDQWEWAKWLPHTHSRRISDGLGPARMISSSLADLEDMLPADVRERPRFTPGAVAQHPHIFIVIDGARVPLSDPIVTEEGVLGVTVIELPSRWEALESSSMLRIAFDQIPPEAERSATKPVPGKTLEAASRATSAELVTRQFGSLPFVADSITIVEAEATARRLMPLYTSTTSVGNTRISVAAQSELVDLLGLPDVRDIDFAEAWAGRLERDRLRVPIGQATDGSPIYLDIKESAQQGVGPHGLIIGATGSGKSEVLRTLVLALALSHSPEQLNFVLVDFKGGATFAGMAGMPHVSAIITNLGEEISLVDRMQDALQGEMVRRQELLRVSGNFANVADYEKARRAGRTDLAPLPALLIVADEFSELLAAKPEFIETFINIGRLGRSLQVHLLLSSQRLEEGKLRGLDSHLSYRIGLRTFSAAESRAVLGVPDAYHLPSEPGGGFLKTDTETMTQFRAAYVSAPPKRRSRSISGGLRAEVSSKVEVFTAAPVWRAAEAEAEFESQPDTQIDIESGREEKRSTFEIAIDRMSAQGPAAHQVWLPPLNLPPTLDQLMPDIAETDGLGLVSMRWREVGVLTVPLGIVDIPLEQRRESLTISLGGAAGHMIIVGGPLSGKSTLARTTMVSLSLTATPEELQFYVLDFGGGSFAGMRDFPHLSGLATRSEPDVVRRTVAEVTSIINQREIVFREEGIDSIETYRQRRASGRVNDGYGDVFLVVDGWAMLRAEFEPLEAEVQAIAARGLTFGVHVIITASRWLELRANIKDLIGTRIELRLGDPSDSEIDRKEATNVPAGASGRGLSSRRLHMLTALPRIDGDPLSNTLVDGVENLIEQITSAWKGESGPKLRLLPEQVSLEEVLALGPPRHDIVIGVDEANLAPFGIDPREEPHLFLYGDAGSGKSTMLRAYAHEIMRLYTPAEAKIFVIDYRRALLGDIPAEYLGGYLTAHDLATSGIADLAAFFESRIPGPDVTAEQLRHRTWWSGAEGFVLVDDYDLVATSQGNPLAVLAPLLAQASDLGLHVILTRRAGGASRASYDPILQRFTDLGTTGILLSGNPDEGQLIGKVKARPAIAGRAQIVSRNRGLIAAQLVLVERSE